MIGAEAAEKPFSVIWPAIDPIPHPGRPPDGLGLVPGKTLWGKTRNSALNWVFKKILQSGRKTLNPLREKFGLHPLSHPFEEYQQAEKVILLSSPSFDYPVSLPYNTHFLAPQLNDPSWAPATQVDIQEPYVLISLGSTFQDQHALYQKLIDTLSQLPVSVIVTLGNVFNPSSFRSYANIQIFQAAAHRDLIPTCGLVIHHGGHGITMKSTVAGLPQLVIPLGRDQFGNAARIVYHGIGLQATPKTPPGRLLKMIKTLLSQEQYGQSAHLMGQKIKEEIQQQPPLSELL
jgi:UDP:flavonoid glycosyltransferase YjiC (YdhE family)